MRQDSRDLDKLWRSAPAAGRRFDPNDFKHLPQAVQRYLAHAIRPGTRLASAVRLRMHGAIKLGRWRTFRAEQVIVADRGTIWRATLRMFGLPVHGFDRFLDGVGVMRWRLAGLIPFAGGSGADISRSSAGRVAAESIWLPSLLCRDGIGWSSDDSIADARFALAGHDQHLTFALNQGCVQSVTMKRWGNPDGGAFRDVDFGADVEQEGTFGGYTIPLRLRVGWHFGSERFDTEGLFFQATIDDAVYR